MPKRMSVAQINHLAKKPEAFIAQCQEAFMTEVLALSEHIRKNKIHFVYISGPSSSGKTTFANTLFHYMEDRTLIPISLDNFFVPQDGLRVNKKGMKDYESIKTIDVAKYRGVIRKILAKEALTLPYFDFEKRQVVDNHTLLTPQTDAIYVIEGLHALNHKICGLTDKEDSVKVYVSPCGQVISSNGKPYHPNDFRFVRRMIRDNYHRAAPPEITFSMWPGVRAGEKRYAYRNKADFQIDTFLFYEPCVLAREGIRLLSSMPEGNRKANRLIRMLRQFEPISRDLLPETSILNEFLERK